MKALNFTIAQHLHRFAEAGDGCNWRWTLLTYGVMRANVRGRFYITQENIARDIGTSDRTVRNALAWLIEKDALRLVSVEERVGLEKDIPADCNVYELTGSITFSEDLTVPYLYGETVSAEASFRSDRKPASDNLYPQSKNNNSEVAARRPRLVQPTKAVDPGDQSSLNKIKDFPAGHVIFEFSQLLTGLNGKAPSVIGERALALLKAPLKLDTGEEIESLIELHQKYPKAIGIFIREWMDTTFRSINAPRNIETAVKLAVNTTRAFGLIAFLESQDIPFRKQQKPTVVVEQVDEDFLGEL